MPKAAGRFWKSANPSSKDDNLARRPRINSAALAAAVASVWLATPSLAQNQCFAPEQLAAKEGERKPVKGIHTFDAPMPATKLASFAPVPQNLRGAIRRVKLPAGKKLIALTLDLCEQPGEVAGYDGAIFDYLRAQGVKATLFTGGKWFRSHSERVQQLLSDPLFELANHSEAHRNLRLLEGAALSEEVLGPQRSYEAARKSFAASQCVAGNPAALARTPPRMNLFRFPFGACNQQSLDAVNDAGLLAIQWDLSTADPSPGQSGEAIAKAMLNAKPGSILIAHANGRGHHTAEGLPLAIPQLKARGFEFVTVSELLAAGTPEVVPTCYDVRPGDSDKYDQLFPLKKPETTAPQSYVPAPAANPALPR
jgi:peptidoglycan-N-acetylglucosamine deacetylase